MKTTLDRSYILLVSALILSVSVNVMSTWQIRSASKAQDLSDDSAYSYVGSDYPVTLPVTVGPAMHTFTDKFDGHYAIADRWSWADWRTLDYFPRHNAGFVRLGPEKRPFGVSMFHQLHCLDMIRQAIVRGSPDSHTQHCFHFIRQGILCAADTTLDPLNVDGLGPDGSGVGTNGVDVTHVCRDWTQVYNFVRENQEHWPPKNVSIHQVTQ